MRWAFRIFSGLFVMTSGYTWTVGQSGVDSVNKNLCDLWASTFGTPRSCEFNKYILLLWGVGAVATALFLIIDFVRWCTNRRKSAGKTDFIGAVDAFNTILSKSKWAQNLRKHPEVMKRGPYETSHTEDENIQRRMVVHLDNEIHDKLRAGELTAWGGTNHGTPLRPIENVDWDEITIMLDRELLDKGSKNACAWLRNDRLVPGGRIRYVEVQFPQTQIRKLFR